MISFRFHIVSITAVFLAIAIGVVVGTTYVDRAVVENLERRIDTVSENLEARRAKNDELEEDLGHVRGYAGASADFAVTDRLTDVPVLVVVPRGVNDDRAADLTALARRAGARVPGVVWLEPSWALGDDEDRARLANVVGADPERSASAIRTEALRALTTALAAPATPETDLAPSRAVLTGLVEDGFLSLDDLGDGAVPLSDLAGSVPRVIVLTSADAAEELDDALPALVGQVTDAGLATVVAEAFVERTDGPGRGELLGATLADDLRDRLVIIDDAELAEGRVAAVLGLVEAAAGRPGHYGYGSGADGVLPAWSAP